MAVQLFILRGVPEEEADEVRSLLAEHQLDYYETPGGSWGMSMPALWLKDESQLAQAQGLLEDYQAQRQKRAQAEYAEMKAQGKQRRVFQLFREHPLRYLIYIIFLAIIVYFSVSPFVNLGGGP